MSSPANTSPTGRETSVNGSTASNVDDKPRLSEHEKKANHIASGKCYGFPLGLAESRLHPRPLAVSSGGSASEAQQTDDGPQNKSAGKPSVKASTDLPNWSRGSKGRAGARASC